jgi:cyclopropane fatty-acyl-phospholipid synthase-like methyltransferase
MMFNMAASNPRNKPDAVLYVLWLQQGQMVADIGAGGGYFSLRLAEIVGKMDEYSQSIQVKIF